MQSNILTHIWRASADQTVPLMWIFISFDDESPAPLMLWVQLNRTQQDEEIIDKYTLKISVLTHPPHPQIRILQVQTLGLYEWANESLPFPRLPGAQGAPSLPRDRGCTPSSAQPSQASFPQLLLLLQSPHYSHCALIRFGKCCSGRRAGCVPAWELLWLGMCCPLEHPQWDWAQKTQHFCRERETENLFFFFFFSEPFSVFFWKDH